MIKKTAILIFTLLCGVTCSNHNSTVFLRNDHKILYGEFAQQCNPNKQFPQMILIPYFERASQVIPNCKTYPAHKTALALFIFYHQWLEYFGDDDLVVRDMLETVMIKWGTEKRHSESGYDTKGERYENRNIIGLVETDSMIWVWQGYNHRISESALFHELVHLAIRAKSGEHGDPDHEGLKYRGWSPAHTQMIIESKYMLRAFHI